jgi:hypothetical protein
MNEPHESGAHRTSAFARAREDTARHRPRLLFIELHNAEQDATLFDLIFRWGDLPRETRIHVAFEKAGGPRPAVTAGPEVLQRHGIVVLCPRQPPFPAERRGPDGRMRRFDLGRIYALSAAHDTLIPKIRVPGGRSLIAAIEISLPAQVTERTLRFEVVQQAGKRIVGGSACFV